MPSSRAAPMLSWRLFFDPSDVGILEPAPWSDAPETALELGLRRPKGQTMAGVDYLASTGSDGWHSTHSANCIVIAISQAEPCVSAQIRGVYRPVYA